jgi:hypothetical protein
VGKGIAESSNTKRDHAASGECMLVVRVVRRHRRDPPCDILVQEEKYKAGRKRA